MLDEDIFIVLSGMMMMMMLTIMTGYPHAHRPQAQGVGGHYFLLGGALAFGR
jgi:hypothetical protein